MDVDHAADTVRQGGVILFPTDTVWGIGCRADNKKAVERIFTIKKRPLIQPLQVLIADFDDLDQIVTDVSPTARELMERFWPGGLTIILPAKENVLAPLVIGEGQTVGVRLPNHQLARQLVRAVGVPLAATSANIHGEKTPVIRKDLTADIVSQIDFVLAGPEGFGVESTVVDATVEPIRIVRQGAVKL